MKKGERHMDQRPFALVARLIIAGLLLMCLTASLNRTLVEMPAWRHVGAEAWAAFSRSADLGNGRVLYPLAGIGGTLLDLAAAIALRLSARRPLSVAIPVYGAALMSVCVLLLTTQAAPIMLSLPRIGDNPAALLRAFEGFYRWDSIRAVFGALGCCADVLALAAILSWSGRNEAPANEKVKAPASR
jgi:hypothetical protein